MIDLGGVCLAHADCILIITRTGGESREQEYSSLVKGEEEVSIQKTSKRTVSKETLWHNKGCKSRDSFIFLLFFSLAFTPAAYNKSNIKNKQEQLKLH